LSKKAGYTPDIERDWSLLVLYSGYHTSQSWFEVSEDMLCSRT